MPTPEIHTNTFTAVVGGFIASAWAILTGDGALPWMFSIWGVVSWTVVVKQESLSTKQDWLRLFGIISTSVVFGVWVAARLAGFDATPIFGFVVAFLGCFVVRWVISEQTQKRINAKLNAILKKGDLP